MRVLTEWIQTPAARALGWTLFHFLWEGIAIAMGLAVALLFMRAARLRYAAACVALGLMLGACVGTFVRVLPDQQGPRIASPVPTTLPPPGADSTGGPRGRIRAEDLLPWAAPVWLAGVLLLHLRTMAGWIGARRLRRSGVCGAPALWQERLRALGQAVRLSTPVALLESCRVDVPLAIGYLRPVILMPVGLVAGMPADQVEAILLHELAHIARRDYLVNLLQTVAENLLFYHPAVWWVSRVIRSERENCCDDLVVNVRGSAHDYAAALTALETRRACAEPALAATGGNLVKRIHRLLNGAEAPHAAFTPALSAGLVILTAVALFAWQPQQPSRPTPQTMAQAATPQPVPKQRRREPRDVSTSAWDKWLHQDVAYIITDDEGKAFQALTTDPEREKFIQQFWERRDPTPGTVVNEFKEEHYRRIGYANGHFSTTESPGWRMDQGRIYIMYGPPDEIERHPAGGQRPVANEQWRYRHIEGMGNDIIIDFNDAQGNGNYRMSAADGSVSKESVWPDEVKRGTMRRQVRGLGIMGQNGAVEIKIAETQAKELALGQVATVDFRASLANGRVARIGSKAENGTIDVTVQLDAAAPAGIQADQEVDASIDIETLNGVVFVGRPVFAKANSDGTLYKIEPDGKHATRVPVRFGRVSVNQIEVVGGLVPGDKVILSDMAPYARFDRVELK